MTRSNGIRKTDEIPISDMDDASVTREAIRDELGAQNSYSQYARQTKDPKAKRVYKDISREEGEHVGELAQVYSEQDPDAVKDMNEGRKEVKNMKSAKKSGAQPNKKSGHIEKYSTEELDKIYAQKKKRPVAEPIDKDDIGGGMTALQEFASMGKGRKAQNMKTALEAAKEMADILGYEGAQRVNFMIGMVKDMTDMHEKNYQDQMTLNRAALDTEKARERKEAAKQPVSNAHTDVNAIVSRGKRDDGTYMTDVLPGKKIPSIISPDDGKKEEEEADVETDKKIFPASGKKDKKPQGELKEVLSVTEQVPHVRGEDPVPTTRPGANDMHNQHLSTFNAEEEGKQILQNHAVNEAHKKKKGKEGREVRKRERQIPEAER